MNITIPGFLSLLSFDRERLRVFSLSLKIKRMKQYYIFCMNNANMISPITTCCINLNKHVFQIAMPSVSTSVLWSCSCNGYHHTCVAGREIAGSVEKGSGLDDLTHGWFSFSLLLLLCIFPDKQKIKFGDKYNSWKL